MEKQLQIEYLKNLLQRTTPFFEELDEGYFNKSTFHNFTRTIFELSKVSMLCEEKYSCAIRIWEISHHIHHAIIVHYDTHDIYHLKNLKDEEINQVSKILFYSANYFSFGKEIEFEYLKIGSWQ